MSELSGVQVQGYGAAESSGSADMTTNLYMESDRKNSSLPRIKSVDIGFTNLTYSVPVGRIGKREMKPLLHNLSGHFLSGELTAIMGPSGSGKSTLMNILAGYRIRNVSGSIQVSGEERDQRLFRKLSCYIMQDDDLLPNLTVHEAMMVAASLKISEKTPLSEKREVITEILETMGLWDSRKTMTCKLSGGQRKRLSIALELVNNPPVMFFDEPTSGLDSLSCWQCVNLLKILARGGRTVICSIHQPSAKLFEMFDKLYLLAEGRCLYKGWTSSLVPFLKSQGLLCPPYHNPADFVIEVACGEYGDWLGRLANVADSGQCAKLQQQYRDQRMAEDDLSDCENEDQESLYGDQNLAASQMSVYTNVSLSEIKKEVGTQTAPQCGPSSYKNGHVPNFADKTNGALISSANCKQPLIIRSRSLEGSEWTTFATTSWTQFSVLFVRTFRCIIRDTMLTKLRFMSHTLVGLTIGLLYYRIGRDAADAINNCASLFFSCLFLMFTALMPTVMTFPLEMNIFIREHMNYWYSLKAYFLAKTMADLPFQILFPTLYGTIIYWMTAQPDDPTRFLLYLTLAILISLVAQSCGLFIGAATSLEAAVFLGPVTAIPILLFSGFFLRLGAIPWYFQWLSYLSYVRYAFEGTLMAIYGFDREKLECENTNATVCFAYRDPKKILELLDVDKAVWWHDLLVLWGFFFFFRLLAYFALRWKVRQER